MENENLFLNISIGAGLFPLLAGLAATFASRDFKERVTSARQIVTPFVVACLVIFSGALAMIWSTTLDLTMNLVLSAVLAFAWAFQLEYLNQSRGNSFARAIETRVSLYQLLFGYENAPRMITSALLIIGWIVFLNLASPPVWVMVTSGAFVIASFWLFEDLKIFKK